MRISACYIVKDEAAELDKSLANLPKVDEIIVVSTAGNGEIAKTAKKYGAKCCDFPWRDDFAAAKNAALEKARGDWIIFLDADEYFASPAKVLPYLEKLAPNIDVIYAPLVNIDADNGNMEQQRFMAQRIWRGGRGIHYVGRVHEALVKSVGELVETTAGEELKIFHTGYSASRMKAKAERNLMLLYADIEQNGEQPKHFRYLADSFMALGEFKLAEHYARQALTAKVKAKYAQSDMAYMLLMCLSIRQAPMSEQIKMTRDFCAEFRELPDFPAWLGLLLALQGKAEAKAQLEKALELSKQESNQASHFGELKARVLAELARIYNVEGSARAEEYLRLAREIDPLDEAVLAAKFEISNLPSEQLLTELTKSGAASAEFFVHFAERNGFWRCFLPWLTKFKNYPRRDFYADVTNSELTEKINNALLADLPLLIRLLLATRREGTSAMGQIQAGLMELLPRELYEGYSAFINEQPLTLGAFNLLWPYFVRFGTAEEIGQLGRLVYAANSERFYAAADELIAAEKWAAALEMLGVVGEDEATGGFWLRTGRALYHVGELDGAIECLSRARELGETSPMIAAYEKWAKEAALNG